MTVNPVSSHANGLPLALTGATAATRYVGATASGSPATGTFAVGDFCIDRTGKIYVCTVAGTPGTWVQIGGSGAQSYAKVSDQKTQNTAGGTFTTGAWRTRDLNTEDTDVDGFLTLAANQVVLSAGTYRAFILMPAYWVYRFQGRLQNVTAGTTLLLGTSGFSTRDATTSVNAHSFISGLFTVAAAQALEVQGSCQSSEAGNGFGIEANQAVEVYSMAEFFKVA